MCICLSPTLFLSVSFRMPNMPNAKKYLHACVRRVSLLSAPSVVFPIFSFTFAFAIPCFSISLGLDKDSIVIVAAARFCVQCECPTKNHSKFFSRLILRA